MKRNKKILCECGHARSHHCRKTNPWTHKYWWGACYHKPDNGFGKYCDCLNFKEKKEESCNHR